MAEPFDPSRRKALKLFSGVPMLPMFPLGGLATASMLSGCGGSDDLATPARPVANFVSAAFSAMAAPTLADPAAMAKTTVRLIADRTVERQQQPHVQARLPAVLHHRRHGAGQQGRHDACRRLLSTSTTSRSSTNRLPGKERQFFSDCPDGSSLLRCPHPTVTGIKGNAVFAVVQFEYTTRDQSA